MSEDDHSTRFAKGRSGNPKGRPKRQPEPREDLSPLKIILDTSLSVNGPEGPRNLTVEEALLQKTFEDALAGKRQARRKIFKMVLDRETARAKAQTAHRRRSAGASKPLKFETDPRNADEAMKLLGIAINDPRWTSDHIYGGPVKDERLLLDTWAVRAALSRRRGGKALTDRDIREIDRCTHEPETLTWPRSVTDG